MKIETKKQNRKWKVEFFYGVQTFTLDYDGTKKECEWMAECLNNCFKKFRLDSLNEMSQTIMKQAICPHNNIGMHTYDNKSECLDCGAEFISQLSHNY